MRERSASEPSAQRRGRSADPATVGTGARRFRPAILVAASIAAAMLTGCGAGQVASTANQASNSTGGNVTVGTIAVRDAVIVFGETAEGGAVYAQGEDAPLSLTIVNEGGDVDRLVSASSTVADAVQISGTTEIPGGRAVVVAGDTNTQGALAPGGAPRVAPNSTPQPAEGATVLLTGLREDIRAGLSYPVTFTFERAGDVTVDVPVGNTDEAREAAEGAE